MVNFQRSYDTRANWLATNRTPLQDELCVEYDTQRQKIGDGTTAYKSLPYLATSANHPSYAIPASPANTTDQVHGAYNWKGSNTRIGDQGISNASKGGMTHELWIGDSASAGCINNITSPAQFDRLNAPPMAMRDQLSNWGVPANGTGFVRTVDGASTVDPRWGGGVNFVGQNGTYTFTSTVNSFITFTSDRPGTMLDVWYNNTFTGTMTVSVDGVTAGTIVGAGTSGWVKKRFANVAVYIGSVVKIQLTTAGNGCGISGISIWSPNNGLIIDNVSQSGSKAYGTSTSGAGSWTDAAATSPLQVFKDVAGRTRQVTDAATTSGSPTLTSATASFTANDVGEPVDFVPTSSGIAFPPGSYILSFTNSTTVTMSTNANATLTAQTANISRDPSTVHLELGGNDIQAGNTMANFKSAIGTIVGTFPKSNIILHLIEEISPTLYTGSAQTDFQQAMFELADSLDVPLYDWRDRTGPYTTASNSVYGDFQAHLNKQSYANLGAALAMLRNGGSGIPRTYVVPVDDGDITNKAYVDSVRRFKTPVTSAVTVSGTTETSIFQIPIPGGQLKVGTTFKVEFWGTLTGTTTPGIVTRLRIGTAGATAPPTDTQVATTNTAIQPTSGTGFSGQAVLTCRSTGASGTVIGFTNNIADAVNYRQSNGTSTVTVDTTTKNYVTVSLLLSGTAPVATVNVSYTLISQP